MYLSVEVVAFCRVYLYARLLQQRVNARVGVEGAVARPALSVRVDEVVDTVVGVACDCSPAENESVMLAFACAVEESAPFVDFDSYVESDFFEVCLDDFGHFLSGVVDPEADFSAVGDACFLHELSGFGDVSLAGLYAVVMPYYGLVDEGICRLASSEQHGTEDTSNKIRAVFKARMKEGKRCSGAIPYGFYRKPDDKNTLYVDEEAAKVVRQIFQMIIDGYGVNQIADTLTEQKVLIPSAFAQKYHPEDDRSKGFKDPYRWSPTAVSYVLAKREYMGHTVLGKTICETLRLRNAEKQQRTN